MIYAKLKCKHFDFFFFLVSIKRHILLLCIYFELSKCWHLSSIRSFLICVSKYGAHLLRANRTQRGLTVALTFQMTKCLLIKISFRILLFKKAQRVLPSLLRKCFPVLRKIDSTSKTHTNKKTLRCETENYLKVRIRIYFGARRNQAIKTNEFCLHSPGQCVVLSMFYCQNAHHAVTNNKFEQQYQREKYMNRN